MVNISSNKKYLTLDGVRISYKAKDDSIHITSTDEDLITEGFHLTLNKGTKSEKILRNLLEENSLITKENKWYGENGIFFLGDATAYSSPFPWEPDMSKHLAVIGKPGTGKTTILNNILLQAIYQAMRHRIYKRYNVWYISDRKLDFNLDIVKLPKEAYNLEDAHKLIKELYEKLVNRIMNPNQPHSKELVIIDGVYDALIIESTPAIDSKNKDTLNMLNKLIELGRANGIYLAYSLKEYSYDSNNSNFVITDYHEDYLSGPLKNLTKYRGEAVDSTKRTIVDSNVVIGDALFPIKVKKIEIEIFNAACDELRKS